MSESYKGFDLNTLNTPRPWGTREGQALKDIIDTIVGASVTGVKTTSGHTHTNATGIQGVMGLAGLAGAQGATGAMGVTGLAGEQGATGAMGMAGLAVQGALGPVGATGVAGLAGAQGTTGLVGTTGMAGVGGVKGSGTAPLMPVWSDSTTLGNSGVSWDGSNVLIPSGNVGIGASPPTAALDIRTTDAYQIHVVDLNGNTNANVGIGSSNGLFEIIPSSSQSKITGDLNVTGNVWTGVSGYATWTPTPIAQGGGDVAPTFTDLTGWYFRMGNWVWYHVSMYNSGGGTPGSGTYLPMEIAMPGPIKSNCHYIGSGYWFNGPSDTVQVERSGSYSVSLEKSQDGNFLHCADCSSNQRQIYFWGSYLTG